MAEWEDNYRAAMTPDGVKVVGGGAGGGTEISSVTPGTDATNLGKAEDAAHSSGDVGVEILSKRTDTAASSAGTDGDYATVNTDSTGHVWSREGFAPVYEDNTNGKAVVEHRYTYEAINTATTTVVKSGAGLVHTITIAGGTAGAITVYDNTAGSGTEIIPTFTPAAVDPPVTLTLDVEFDTGLTIVTAAATVITVSYR